MNESTIFCPDPESIESATRQVENLLRCQSFENATGESQAYEIEVRPYVGKRRTNQQNRAIHQYCTMLAKDLNDAGYERVIDSKVLEEPIHLPWDQASVKEHLWHTVQRKLTDVQSSADLGTKEVNLIYQAIARHLAKTFAITTPFPSRFGG